MNARLSDYVQDEIAIADMEGCTILAVWAIGLDKRWLDSAPLGYGKLHYADMRGDNYDTGLKKIIAALNGVPLPVNEPEVAAEPDDTNSNLVSPKGDLKSEFSSPPPIVPAITAIMPSNSIGSNKSPYKALDAFTTKDADIFFGRDRLIEALLKRLETFPSFLTVIGASGAGKSSVVMAGLLPRLEKLHPDWKFLPPIKPGERPIEALATMLFRTHFRGGDFKGLQNDLRSEDSRGLILRANAIERPPKARVVLLVDQFEEVFTQTQPRDAVEAEIFINLLVAAAVDKNSGLTVILTFRADFYDRLLANSNLAILIRDHSEPILPLTIAELRQTIERPASLAGLRFDDGLVSDLVDDARGQPGNLPLLQFTLDQLYQKRQGTLLSSDVYKNDIGGLKGSLKGQAEETYKALPDDEHRELARQMFMRLIEPGKTEQDTTRRRAPKQEFDSGNMKKVIDAFVEARLLTFEADTLEVSHEALIREWPRLGLWLDTDRDNIRLRKGITETATEWMQKGELPEYLYSGSRLTEAEALKDLNTLEKRFVKDSRLEEDRLKQENADLQQKMLSIELDRAERYNRRAQIAGLVAIVAAIVTGIALAVAANARDQSAFAQSQLDTAAIVQATSKANSNVANTQIANGQSAFNLKNTAVVEQNTAVAQKGVAVGQQSTAAALQNTALAQKATLQYEATESVFDQERLAKLVPIIA